jgi:hypothetical protein
LTSCDTSSTPRHPPPPSPRIKPSCTIS